jgi:hypothetical protein
MKKRNKAYKPKHIVIDSAFRTIRLAKPVTEDSKALLNEQIHGALLAITNGAGQTTHFDILASTVDVVYLMSQNLFDNAYGIEILRARGAMFRLKDRFHKHGTFGFDGEGYQAIKELIAIHDEMLNKVTGAEVLQFMKARAKAINEGNFYKGAAEKLAA